MKTNISTQTLAEITDKRDRDKIHSPRWIRFNSRFSMVMKTLDVINKKEVSENLIGLELRRYYPIALIACLEDYSRLVIRDLIDFGDPYFSNLTQLSNFEMKLDVLVQMNKSKIKFASMEFDRLNPDTTLPAKFERLLQEIPLKKRLLI